MKQMRFKWKYLLASILLANIIACSNDDLAKIANRQEYDSGTRTAELVTKTITLETEGTLEAKVSEAMGDSAVSTLEKLVVSGPFTSTDMQYLRDSLTGLSILDMEGVQIKASDVSYKYIRGYSRYESYFVDDEICKGMFYEMDNLKEVVLPEAITNIGNEAFYSCDSLRSVIMSDNVVSICEHAFSRCRLLSSIRLSANLEVIKGYAFSYCAIKSIDLPLSLKDLHGCSFEYCFQLESIELPYGLEKIGGHTFYHCSNLRTLNIPETVTFVDGGFANYSGLRYLIWNTKIDVPYCYFNSSPLLFVTTDQIAVENVNDYQAVIINGVTDETINIDNGSDFNNPKEFKTNKLVYNKSFYNETYPGYSSGWETIVLPFTPDSIYHETKGQIAPFNSGIEGAKPFWLRELTEEGFVDVTKIEANKPYIIAMPNHSDYLDEYRLNGKITFVARNSVLTVTPDVLLASKGPDYELHPTYKYVERSSDVYALASIWHYYQEDNMYYSKSFFVKDRNGVERFNAYVTTLDGGRSSRALFDLDTRSKETRAAWIPNKTGIPQIGDM